MSFKRIDDDAFDNDRPLSQAVLIAADRNVRGVRSARRPAGTWHPGGTRPAGHWAVPDTSWVPEMSCYDDRVAVLLDLYVREQDLEYTIRVRGLVAGSEGGVLSVASLSKADAQTGTRVGGDEDSETIAGPATIGEYELTLDVSSYSDEWITAFVMWQSDVGTTATDFDDGGATQYLDSWSYAQVTVDSANTVITASDPQPHRVVELYSTTTGDNDERLPLPRQALVVLNGLGAGSRDSIWVYPPFDRTSAEMASTAGVYGPADDYEPAEDGLRWYELGAFTLHGIEAEVTSVRSEPARGSTLEVGQVASVSIPTSIHSRTVREWFDAFRYHHIGPTLDPGDTSARFAEHPVYPIGLKRTADNVSTWETLATAVVGGGTQYVNPATGTAYTRSLYDVSGWGILHHIMNAPGDPETSFNVRYRLVLTDTDGTSNTVTGDELVLACPSSAFFPRTPDRSGRYPYAYLLGFYLYVVTVFGAGTTRTGSPNTPEVHALRGLWPVGRFSGARKHAFRLQVLDTSPDDVRLMHLQVRHTRKSLEGRTVPYNRHLHLMTWSVIDAPVPQHVWDSIGAA